MSYPKAGADEVACIPYPPNFGTYPIAMLDLEQRASQQKGTAAKKPGLQNIGLAYGELQKLRALSGKTWNREL